MEAKGTFDFTPLEKREILEWCREVLKANLKGVPEPGGPDLSGNGGVFVTLKKNGELRGCIGVFDWSRPIKETISRMTKAAAFADHRFEKVDISEVDDLEIIVSVLTEPETLSNIDDIVIGRDGLYLIHPMGRGVLLPVVAVELGLDPLQFVKTTCRKAGLPTDTYKDPAAKLMVFRAPDFSSKDF